MGRDGVDDLRYPTVATLQNEWLKAYSKKARRTRGNALDGDNVREMLHGRLIIMM